MQDLWPLILLDTETPHRGKVIVIPTSDHLAELEPAPDCRVGVWVTETRVCVCVFLFLLKFICLMGDKLVVPVDRFLVASSLGPWGKKEGERRA